jgi:hypothetical protein
MCDNRHQTTPKRDTFAGTLHRVASNVQIQQQSRGSGRINPTFEGA